MPSGQGTLLTRTVREGPGKRYIPLAVAISAVAYFDSTRVATYSAGKGKVRKFHHAGKSRSKRKIL
jgi:hypothetical protein